ncbi:uncharacterized protein LOC144517375 isoform X1 [Sander vitreus]
MGIEYSQEDYDNAALQIYDDVLQHQPCLLPDIGIDESLLKYSGSDSNAALQAYSNEVLSETLADEVPGYIEKVGSAFGSLTSVPNAVGLGALVISMIIEIIIKGDSQSSDHAYSLLRRVFGEEKASSVRDTMSEYLKRHRMFMNNDQRLREEIRRLEHQLSNHLTILRNSLLHDGQMSSRGFKIWVNGAAFHVQMLIHEARLNIQTGTPASDHVNAIKAAIDVYLQDLDNLLEKHKTYKINSKIFRYLGCYRNPQSYMTNNEHESCRRNIEFARPNPCSDPKAVTTFRNLVYSNYEPIRGLKSYFLKIKNNLNSLIRQRGTFTLPSGKTFPK